MKREIHQAFVEERRHGDSEETYVTPYCLTEAVAGFPDARSDTQDAVPADPILRALGYLNETCCGAEHVL